MRASDIYIGNGNVKITSIQGFMVKGTLYSGLTQRPVQADQW